MTPAHSMISRIQIRDFVLIDRLDVHLGPGLTVLTGETGAGKSILVDAIALALGGRAEGGWVRPGRERAEIVLSFDLEDRPAACQWLQEQELDDDDDPTLCIVRRTLRAAGGSRGYLNGRPVTAAQLRQLGERLVDIHGQHQHQSLLRPFQQQQLLDAFGGHTAWAREVAELARAWEDNRRALERLEGERGERERRIDFLRYQVDELERLAPEDGEWERLTREHDRLANLEGLLSAAQGGLELLREGDDTVEARLEALRRALAPYVPLDAHVKTADELLQEAQIQLQEAAAELGRAQQAQELDPEAYQAVARRMEEIHDLARKHRSTPERLNALLEELRRELARLESGEGEIQRLRQQAKDLKARWTTAAARLSAARARAAEDLARQVTALLQELGMAGSRLEVALEPRGSDHPHPGGAESVAFLVTTNAGMDPAPLARVASGGELSRISLAIQVVTAQLGGIPTLIFDEVDVGVGGGVAELVGEKLRLLSERRQVLCVTHLPQVAAQGHHHLRTHKHRRGQETVTELEVLDPAARVEEIARMLGGRQITRRTREHAREMLAAVR